MPPGFPIGRVHEKLHDYRGVLLDEGFHLEADGDGPEFT